MRYCSNCGKQIADEAVICLNCGCKTDSGRNDIVNNVTVQDNDNSMALWSMICGIVSFFIGWFALGITAMVLSNLSKKDTNGEKDPMATAGFVCGLISTIIYSFVFIIIIAALSSI